MHDTQIWFLIGVPAVCVVAILFDRLFAPRRGRFIARSPRPPAAATPATATAPDTATPTPVVASSTETPSTETPSTEVPTTPSDVDAELRAPYDVALEDPDPSDRSGRPEPTPPTWRPGLSLRTPTADGHAPSEATVRKRAWMAYATIASADELGAANIARLERGRPPVRFNPLSSMLEAQQISVDENGRSTIRWFDSDESVDPFAVAAEPRGG